MAGPAPTEFLEKTEDHDAKLQQEVAAESTKEGHPATLTSVNPDDNTPLEKIREDLRNMGHDATHIAGTLAGDETARNRISRESPIKMAFGRWLKRIHRKAA